MERLTEERADLRNWGRNMIEFFMVERARELQLNKTTTVIDMSNFKHIKLVLQQRARNNDTSLNDDMYTITYGQFTGRIQQSLSPNLREKALSFVSDPVVRQTDFREQEAAQMNLIECLAVRYQLTHFQKPFVYSNQYEKSLALARSSPGRNGTDILLGLPRHGRWFAGFVTKIMNKC